MNMSISALVSLVLHSHPEPASQLIQGGFFNWASPENVSILAPPINPSTGPPLNLLSMRITNHLDFFRSLGTLLPDVHFLEQLWQEPIYYCKMRRNSPGLGSTGEFLRILQ